MNYPQNKPSEIPCQPFFENELNFNPENQLLHECGIYCLNIMQQESSPWQRHANLMGYWSETGQTKISKLQRNLLHYLHQWYFSKGNPAYLKTKNLAKHLKTSRRNTIRAVTRLINRGILLRLEYWSDKYQRFRSVILPQLHKTLKEKLVFILQKRTHPIKETDTGGRGRYLRNTLNSLRIQKCNIYINILYTNYYANNYSLKNLTTLNYASLSQGPAQRDSSGLNPVPINPLLSNARGIENMQTELKPKRITLKVQNEITCPSSINESIKILIKKDFDPKSIPHVALSDLLYHIENKIFSNHGDNDPNLKPPDINSFFRVRMFDQSKFVEQYDTKLFKMLMRLFVDNKNFHDKNLIIIAKRIIGYWSTCARNNKGNNTKFTNHNSNLTTKVGFKIYIGFLYHMYYTTFNYDKSLDPEFFGEKFKTGINRFFKYSYILNLPKKVAFDTALIDHTDSDRFIKCLTLSNEDFYAFVNSSKRNYQARPESKKSLNNFREIFVGTFYEKDRETGRERFEQYRPKFSRFLEILITRIEKYSDNGKRVELSGLKLTAETSVDMPVLYYYMEWLRNSIFSETVFRFDQMFSLENWNSFIKKFMRDERGYSDYWKIVDRN